MCKHITKVLKVLKERKRMFMCLYYQFDIQCVYFEKICTYSENKQEFFRNVLMNVSYCRYDLYSYVPKTASNSSCEICN